MLLSLLWIGAALVLTVTLFLIEVDLHERAHMFFSRNTLRRHRFSACVATDPFWRLDRPAQLLALLAGPIVNLVFGLGFGLAHWAIPTTESPWSLWTHVVLLLLAASSTMIGLINASPLLTDGFYVWLILKELWFRRKAPTPFPRPPRALRLIAALVAYAIAAFLVRSWVLAYLGPNR